VGVVIYNIGNGEACAGFLWENLRERDHWGDPGVDGKDNIKMDFQKWIGLSWLGIEIGGGHL
jgi:hypothetical protein